MRKNVLIEISKEFAVKIINLCDSLKNCYTISNQLSRSGTSIGANIHEAQYAHGKADFISKLEIALKECSETEYWLEILYKTGKIDESNFKTLKNDAGTIRKILIKSCTTAKSSKQKN